MATAETASNPTEELDLFLPLRSRGGLEDPFAIYALLRTVRPVMRMPIPNYEGPGVWFLTRYADVNEALRDPRLSVDRTKADVIRRNLDRLPGFIQQTAAGARSMLTMDPPDHTRLRKLVNKAFTPRRIAGLRGRIVEIVDELLDAVKDRSEFDLIDALAAPLPAIVIAELLGVPSEDRDKFKAWAAEIVAGIGNFNTRAQSRSGVPAITKLFGYLGEIIAERRAGPRDDLISAMIAAQEENDSLSDQELLATSNLLLIAGHETTTNLVGNGTLALLHEPDEMRRLRADMDLLPTAIEELLRYDGPVQATLRTPTEDIEIDGHTIEAGALILIGIGAANHDPEVFEDPERLDITRDPNPHIAFGFGVHFCLGAALARLEGEIAFRALLERYSRIELAEEAPKHRPNPVLRGLESLCVRV